MQINEQYTDAQHTVTCK